MEDAYIQNLITRFNNRQLTTAEQKELEGLIESGRIDLDAFENLMGLDAKVQMLGVPEPSSDLDDRFYQMLSLQKKKARLSLSWAGLFSMEQLAPKLAFASVTLIIGLALGYFLNPAPATRNDYQALSDQVTELREMMMLSLLEKESATERLRAVSLTQEMDGVSAKVTAALIKTLNTDENVNVRLAALEALIPYVKDSQVRAALIRSISKQESPLVQVALSELMAQIQEKSSVKELQKIIQSERTPTEVKTRIKESIKVLS
jgi:hypothetical protein